MITGAAGGVGHATAELLASEGASVALADIRADALEAAAASIKGDAFAVRMDLGEPTSIAAAINAAEARLGPLDGLVNCAAIVIHADPLETGVEGLGENLPNQSLRRLRDLEARRAVDDRVRRARRHRQRRFRGR